MVSGTQNQLVVSKKSILREDLCVILFIYFREREHERSGGEEAQREREREYQAGSAL